MNTFSERLGGSALADEVVRRGAAEVVPGARRGVPADVYAVLGAAVEVAVVGLTRRPAGVARGLAGGPHEAAFTCVVVQADPPVGVHKRVGRGPHPGVFSGVGDRDEVVAVAQALGVGVGPVEVLGAEQVLVAAVGLEGTRADLLVGLGVAVVVGVVTCFSGAGVGAAVAVIAVVVVGDGAAGGLAGGERIAGVAVAVVVVVGVVGGEVEGCLLYTSPSPRD